MNPIKKLYRKLTNWRWEIGFLENTLEELISGKPLKVHWVNLPFRNRWFADPFIFDYDEREIILLCEEYSDELRRGRIAKLVVDRKDYSLKSWKIVLDLPTHLSFPRVIRKGNEVYVHPENSASGRHALYRYDRKKDILEYERIICFEPLTDAIMLEYQKKQLMFSTYLPLPNGNVLTVFQQESDSLYHKIGQASFDNNCARMAGDFFTIGNKLYRPAQDCNGGYGKAIILQEAHCDDEGKWQFEDIQRITSPHPILTWGLHTFNHYKGLIVLDVKGPRFPMVAFCLGRVKRWVSYL